MIDKYSIEYNINYPSWLEIQKSWSDFLSRVNGLSARYQIWHVRFYKEPKFNIKSNIHKSRCICFKSNMY